MRPRTRVLAFGAAIIVIVLSGPIDAIVGGVTGEAIAISLGSLGLIALVSLVFLEVGLSEDRERAREDRNRAREDRDRARADEQRSRPPSRPLRPTRLPRRPRRPG